MGSKKPTVLGLVFKSFLDSLRPHIASRKLVGKDYWGTKYYETQPRKNSMHNKPNRHFEPVNKDKFDQEIPAEWEAWLRQRRRDPPTEEEVNKNYQAMMTKKKNAAELEATYADKKDGFIGTGDNTVPRSKPQEPQVHSSSGGYPVYEEYKEYGQKYKTKP